MDSLVVLFGEKDCLQHQKAIGQFHKIYLEAFPNSQEKEDFEKDILPRLKAGPGASEPLELQTLAALIVDDNGEVAAGMIVSWYPRAVSLEIIYLAVRESSRWKKDRSANAHYGTRLIKEGIEAIINRLDIDRKAVLVYLEAENPFHPDNAACRQECVGRLRFFANCNARRIPISYVQPPLSRGKDYARNLFLFVLPVCDKEQSIPEDVPRERVKTFLDAFYKELKNRAEDQELFKNELQAMQRSLVDAADEKDNIPLDQLSETHHLSFEKIAISSHFLILDRKAPMLLKAEKTDCPQWGSYENDLFNYANQEPQPLTTHFARLYDENILLPLPEFYTYTSEGLSYYKLSERTSIPADVSVSWSTRHMSGKTVRVAHMTIVPHVCKAPSYFTEMEAIKIIALLGFGSRQERFNILEDERARINRFFLTILQESLRCESFRPLGTGVTEINRLNVRQVSANMPQEYMRNALCGILLGIFDFARMSSIEASVTLSPIYQRPEDKIWYYSSRGHLLRIKERTPKEDERLVNLLISPYLLNPSAVLCFNELLLQRATGKLKRLILFRNISSIKRSLSSEILTDVFQYESEKVILNKEMSARSLSQEKNRLINLCEISQSKIIHFMEAIQATLLAIIAMFQIRGVFESNPGLFWILLAILTLLFLSYSFLRLKE